MIEDIMKVNCSYCGTEISKPKGKVKSSDNHFCNNECRSRFHDNKNRSKHEKLKLIINYIDNNNNVTKRELEKQLDINKHTMKNYLRKLREMNKLILKCEDKYLWKYELKFNNVSLRRTTR